MSNRFVEMAKETIAISESGFYTVNGKIVGVDRTDNTKIFYDSSYDTLIDVVKRRNLYHSVCNIECASESTVDAVFRVGRKYNDLKLGVLNFASARHPGGGFENGAMAQEECLAYCSDLFRKQKGSVGKEYYTINCNRNSAFYTDTMLMSNVTFFRDGSYNFVTNPIMCSVLTAPAVNKNLTAQRGVSSVKADKVMKERMRKILYVFAHECCDTIVLGAFGCGVFGNRPEDVAGFWKELLIDSNMKQYFNHIIFSIYETRGRNTFEVFKRNFSK